MLADLDAEHVDRSLTLSIQRALSRRKGLVAAAAVVLAVGAAAFWVGRGGDTAAPIEGTPELDIRKFAILPLTNAANDAELEWLRTGIPDMLVTDISQSQYLRPVSSDRILKVMRELGISEHTRFDEAAIDSVSERTGSESVLTGNSWHQRATFA